MRQWHVLGSDRSADQTKRFFAATGIIGAGMLLVASGGFVVGSLTLLGLAAHMLATLVLLALNSYVRYAAVRWGGRAEPFPLDRLKPLVTYSNGLVMLVCGILIIVAAGQRVLEPVAVSGWQILIVAIVALLVNASSGLLLFGWKNAARRGAPLHVLVDVFLAAAAAGVSIMLVLSGWVWLDTLLAVLIAVLLFMSAFALLHVSGLALLDSTSARVDGVSIARDIESNVKGVVTVRDVHVWSLDGKRNRATLHACLNEDVDPHAVICDIKLRLAKHHRIEHVTVEPEFTEPVGRPAGTMLH